MCTELDSNDSPVVSASSDFIDITGYDEIDSLRIHSVLFDDVDLSIGDSVELGENKNDQEDSVEDVGPSDRYGRPSS
ncbi:hypothetical protein ACJIZ3_006091 [Penstemon smallii]|uniref:Uncharacterized protein n=1 Tax=Penstemon smallii TaxID=265156 RepID=A0ABD3S6W0_9LAMI